MEHTCDERCLIVNGDSTLVCRVTGECFQQFISANLFKVEPMQMIMPSSPTGGGRPVKKARQLPSVNDRQIYEKIRSIVMNLLYSDVRQSLSSDTHQCELPSASSHRHHKKRRIIRDDLKVDSNIVDSVVEETASILKMVLEKRPFLKHKSVIIAGIYLQQHGKNFQTKSGKQFNIRDCEYLYTHLPSIGDLKRFGFPKNLVRIGTNIIQEVTRDI